MKSHWIRGSSLLAVMLLAGLWIGCSDDDKNGSIGSIVSGTVVNSQGNPVADIAVSINTTPAKIDTTAANGQYAIADVPAGTYALTFSGANFVTTTTNVTVTDGDPSTTVGNTAIIANNELTGTVSGIVMGNGAAVAGADVRLYSAVTQSSVSKTSDAAGAYSFSPVVVGDYTVIVSKSGFVADSADVTVTASTTTTANFTLTQSVVLAGSLTDSLRLDATKVYTLTGVYQIQPGGRLYIPAGTKIEAEPGTQAAIITVRASASGSGGIVKPNGKIFAEGTSVNPVVFTTKTAPGARTRGLWGGIVLNGIADINVPGKIGVGEGNTGSYGPGGFNSTVQTTIADTMSSGILRYVRVEFGGIKITPDNEINGFTFNGVGSNTVLEHLQSHMIADDGFEWFGGRAQAKWLVASGCDDDMFDTDFGFNGHLQFLFGIQDKSLGNRGMEADNDATGSANMPISKPTVWNFTFIGGNDTDDKNNDDNNEGMYWRRNTQYDANNGIVAYFNRIGLALDGTADSTNAANGTATARNMILFNNLGGSGYKHINQVALKTTFNNYDTVGLRSIINGWNINVTDPAFTAVNSAGNGNPLNGTLPNPTRAITVGGTPPASPAGFYDQSATYIGAFDAANNWLSGWTIWSTN